VSGGSPGGGTLSACTWPTPAAPDAGGWLAVGAARTVLFCGVGNVNNVVCLSSSTTECIVPPGVYGGDGPCNQTQAGGQCTPCTPQCTSDEYAIGVGVGISNGPTQPMVQPPTLPASCRMNVVSGLTPWVAATVPGFLWTYACCPCE
jgi:hypothetical protein